MAFESLDFFNTKLLVFSKCVNNITGKKAISVSESTNTPEFFSLYCCGLLYTLEISTGQWRYC